MPSLVCCFFSSVTQLRVVEPALENSIVRPMLKTPSFYNRIDFGILETTFVKRSFVGMHLLVRMASQCRSAEQYSITLMLIRASL